MSAEPKVLVVPAERVARIAMTGAAWRAQRRVARVIHEGPYEQLSALWGRLGDWLIKNRLTPAPNLWERYLVAPAAVADPALYLTELNRPLAE